MFMIDILILLYTKSTYFPKNLKFPGMLVRKLISLFTNLLFPLLFRFNQKKHYLNGRGNNIVSITSFPERIKKVSLVIECLLRQTVKPSKIIIWLSSDQFNDISDLPKQLIHQTKRGLEIRLVEKNLLSHKKYYYALKEFPDFNLITIDDDFFYPSYLIKNLVEANKNIPNVIFCCRGFKINVKDNQIDKYSNWTYLKDEFGPSFEIFQTSGGGSLYPPKSLHTEVLNDSCFMKICPSADDVWLNLMAQLNNTKTFKLNNHFESIPIIINKNIVLSEINVGLGQNDNQINNLRDYLILKFNADPFLNVLNRYK